MFAPAALYYPHTNITDPNIIKNSLLLWDQVEYITPWNHWTHQRFGSKSYNEAIDIVTKPHQPTTSEKNEVHNRVKSLVEKGLPSWFYLPTTVSFETEDEETFSIYPEKLHYETWRLLQSTNLARFHNISNDYHARQYLGLLIMSLLAEACAGETKRKITDRTEAYSWLQKFSTADAGGEYITGLDASQVAPAYNRLVTLSIRLLNTDDIPIDSLVTLRKRELKSSSKDYRGFRIRYLKKVDEYINKITSPALRHTDIVELERQFQKEMEADLKELRTELRLTKDKMLWSKEIGIAATATAGAITRPIEGLTDLSEWLLTIGVGALIRAGKEYNAARDKALKNSSMSWLYLSHRHANRFDPRKIIV